MFKDHTTDENAFTIINGGFHGAEKIFGNVRINGNAKLGISNQTMEVAGHCIINGVLKGVNVTFLKSVLVNGTANLLKCSFQELFEIRGSLKVRHTNFSTLHCLGYSFTLKDCQSNSVLLKVPDSFWKWSLKLILIDTIVLNDLEVEGTAYTSCKVFLRGRSKIQGSVAAGIEIVDETNAGWFR